MYTQEELQSLYGTAESQAIEEHKYFLGTELHFDPGLDLAVESWERYHAAQWRAERMRRDAEEQVRVIEAYRLLLCERYRREVDFAEAAHEWVERFGAEWRRRREAEAAVHAMS
jgi:hypothetical protein